MISNRQKFNIINVFIDVLKTLGSAFFVWGMIKGVFNLAGEHEQARILILIMSVVFYGCAIILTMENANLEDEL